MGRSSSNFQPRLRCSSGRLCSALFSLRFVRPPCGLHMGIGRVPRVPATHGALPNRAPGDQDTNPCSAAPQSSEGCSYNRPRLCGNQDGKTTARNNGHQARRVETAGNIPQRGTDTYTAFFHSMPLLVAYAPEDDARTGCGRGLLIRFNGRVMFLGDARQTVSSIHKNSEAVARHRGISGVIGFGGKASRACSRTSSRFAPISTRGVRECRRLREVVLVHVCTFQFQRLSVQEEALVSIEADCTSNPPIRVGTAIHTYY